MPSRDAIEKTWIRRGSRSELPAVGAAGFPVGHIFVDDQDGTMFRNEGTTGEALYTGLGRHHFLDERFLQLPGLNANAAAPAGDTYNTAQMDLTLLKNRNFELLGTNASADDITFADGGGVTIETDGAANDFAVILPHLDTGISAWSAWKWNTNDEPIFEAVITSGASVAGVRIWAGYKLTNTSVVATDDDQVMFLFDTGHATSAVNWLTVSSNNGTDDIADSGVVLATATTYHLKISVSSTRIPSFIINGVLVGTGAALAADHDLIPYVGVFGIAAAAKKITVRYLRCGKTLND